MALPGGTFTGDGYTKTRGNVLVPELWADEIRRERDQALNILPYLKAYAFEGKKADQLNIPVMHRVGVNTKTAETPVAFQARSFTEFVMNITQYKESSHLIEDILEIQSKYSVRNELTREVGYALARDMNNFALGLRAAINGVASQRVYSTADGTASGSAAGSLNQAAILTAKEILDLNDVPMEGRVLLVGWQQYNALLTIDEFINMDYQAAAPVSTGVVGRLYNIPVVATSLIGINSDTGFVNGTGATPGPSPGVASSIYLPDQEDGAVTPLPLTIGNNTAPAISAIMCHPDWAIAAVQKSPSIEQGREIPLLSDFMVASQLYGMKTYRQDHAVVIHTAA